MISSDGYLIRPMRSADVDRVREIAENLKNTPHWPRTAYLAALDPHAAPRRVALVAVETLSDLPVGYAIAGLVPPGAELESIAVAGDRQRRGLGRGLLLRLFDVLQQDSIEEVWLEVRVSNKAAISLYRRAGFVENGVRKAYYVDPAEDAAVMRLTMD